MDETAQRGVTATVTAPAPLESVSDVIRRRKIGPYILGNLLGHGGMGAVYEAVDERCGVRLALKALPVLDDDLRIRALKREFRALSDYAHRNVVRMYDLVADASGWYVAMELIDGVHFEDFLRPAGGHWSDERAYAALRELASGLLGLHQRGWIHRDLKSSNVLVERASARIVLLDFGLAEHRSQAFDRETRPLGTWSHMAPELLQGAPASSASDMYALGVMLYRAIAGRAAANSQDGSSVYDGAKARLAEHQDVALPLRQLCLDLLATLPEARPDAAQLLGRLGATLVPGASPPPWTLVGRQDELARLQELWRQASAGAKVLTTLEGEAGLGKTTLAERFVAEVELHAHVFRSRCHANETIPFKALDRVIEQLAASLAPPSDADAAPPASSIAAVFSALVRRDEAEARPAAPNTPLPSQRRAEAFRQLREQLLTLSRERPVLLFVEDVHWGDADSAQLLRALLSEPPAADSEAPRARIMVLATQRPGADAGAFVRELWRVGPLPGCAVEKLVLPRLDAPSALQIARQARPDLEPEALEAVVHAAEGSPLLLAKSYAVGRVQTWQSPASYLQAVVDADVEPAPPFVRRLLTLIAAASAPLTIDVAFRALGSDVDVHRAVADLRAARLVSLRGGGVDAHHEGNIELYHDQLRGPILERLTPDEQRALHRDLACSLEDCTNPRPGLIASHFQAAGEGFKAARYAERAARAADAALAFAAAAQHYRDALAWHQTDPESEARLQQGLAEALFNAGQAAESARAFQQLRRRVSNQASQSLAPKEANAWFACGYVDQGIGSIQPLLRELALLAPPDQKLLAALMFKVLRLRLRGSRFPVAIDARVDPDQAFRADVCWAMGQGLSMYLSKQGSYYALQSLNEALPTRDPHRVGRGLALLGGTCANLGPLWAPWGESLLRSTESIAEQTSDAALMGHCLLWRAHTQLVSAQFAQAQELARRAITLMERSAYAMSWQGNTARCFALMARERCGDLNGVRDESRQIFQHAMGRDDLFGSVVFALFLAQTAVARGDLDEARALARDTMQRWSKDCFTIQHFYALRVEVYCDLYEGALQRAQQRLTEAWPQVMASDVADVPSAKLEAHTLQAHVSLAAARASGAARDLAPVKRVVRVLRKSGPEAAAHASLLEACLRACSGASAAAQGKAFAQAAGNFAALSMPLWAAVAGQRACAAQGADTPRRSQEQTLRELGVAEPTRWLGVIAPTA